MYFYSYFNFNFNFNLPMRPANLQAARAHASADSDGGVNFSIHGACIPTCDSEVENRWRMRIIEIV